MDFLWVQVGKGLASRPTQNAQEALIALTMGKGPAFLGKDKSVWKWASEELPLITLYTLCPREGTVSPALAQASAGDGIGNFHSGRAPCSDQNKITWKLHHLIYLHCLSRASKIEIKTLPPILFFWAHCGSPPSPIPIWNVTEMQAHRTGRPSLYFHGEPPPLVTKWCNILKWSWEVAQLLRALAALGENLGSIPCTHKAAHNHAEPGYWGSNSLFWLLWSLHTCSHRQRRFIHVKW